MENKLITTIIVFQILLTIFGVIMYQEIKEVNNKALENGDLIRNINLLNQDKSNDDVLTSDIEDEDQNNIENNDTLDVIIPNKIYPYYGKIIEKTNTYFSFQIIEKSVDIKVVKILYSSDKVIPDTKELISVTVDKDILEYNEVNLIHIDDD